MPRSKEHEEILGRFFGELPVRDAAHELRIFPTDADKDKADRNDPANCVFAKACNRLFQSFAVVFFGSIAYVDLPDHTGKRFIERFEIPKVTRNSISAFDEAGAFDPGGYLIVPPAPSKRLDYINRQNAKNPRKKLIPGVNTTPKPPAQPKTFGTLRNGGGMVQFLRSKGKRNDNLKES